MNSTALKALQDLNLATNSNKEITAAKVREFTTELIRAKGGWQDVDNSAAAQPLTGGQWTVLTNDGLGGFSNDTYKPYWVDSLYGIDADNVNAVILTGLEVGTWVELRMQFTAVPGTSNDYIDIRANFRNSSTVSQFTLLFEAKQFKAASSKTWVASLPFYVGSAIEGGSVVIEARPNINMNVRLDGILIKVSE
jgi:hypothetical protein